jgi:hypothetical protein
MKHVLSTESVHQQTHESTNIRSSVNQLFTDNRESAAMQRQLMSAMTHSPQAIAQRKISQLMNNNPQLLAQRKMLSGEPVQRVEEDESLQKKSEPIQRVEEEELQKKATTDSPAQLKEQSSAKPNNTGLPDNLKSGIESLSGMSMDSVRVHYNSPQPAQLNALAYAQGTDIHVAPGQEQHLPHEAWHIVQQAQGRVRPTMQMKDGVPINDDEGLEHEADVMGAKALQRRIVPRDSLCCNSSMDHGVAQLTTDITYNRGQIDYWAGGAYWHSQNVGVNSIAYLDPTDPKTGSRTGAGAGIYTNSRYNLYQGHLLNANLGGQATTENLFPISPELNRAHSSQVEDHVKSNFLYLNTQKANNVLGWNNRRLYYRVQVQHPNLNDIRPATIAQTQFHCTSFFTDNLNPGGHGGVAQDNNLPHLNLVVQAPYNLNAELANINFAPDAAPTYTVGPHPGGVHGPNVRTVLDTNGITVPNMLINI